VENKEYQTKAVELENKDYPLLLKRLREDPVFTYVLLETLEQTRRQLNLIDQIKKCLIYGKKSEYVEHVRSTTKEKTFADADIQGIVNKFTDTLEADQDFKLIRLLHGVLGKSSEQEEMIEALQSAFETGKIDSVNWLEELGDDSWYSALLASVFGFSFNKINATNIAKLDQRNKVKGKNRSFDNRTTLDRDVQKEREILEESDRVN